MLPGCSPPMLAGAGRAVRGLLTAPRRAYASVMQRQRARLQLKLCSRQDRNIQNCPLLSFTEADLFQLTRHCDLATIRKLRLLSKTISRAVANVSRVSIVKCEAGDLKAIQAWPSATDFSVYGFSTEMRPKPDAAQDAAPAHWLTAQGCSQLLQWIIHLPEHAEFLLVSLNKPSDDPLDSSDEAKWQEQVAKDTFEEEADVAEAIYADKEQSEAIVQALQGLSAPRLTDLWLGVHLHPDAPRIDMSAAAPKLQVLSTSYYGRNVAAPIPPACCTTIILACDNSSSDVIMDVSGLADAQQLSFFATNAPRLQGWPALTHARALYLPSLQSFPRDSAALCNTKRLFAPHARVWGDQWGALQGMEEVAIGDISYSHPTATFTPAVVCSVKKFTCSFMWLPPRDGTQGAFLARALPCVQQLKAKASSIAYVAQALAGHPHLYRLVLSTPLPEMAPEGFQPETWTHAPFASMPKLCSLCLGPQGPHSVDQMLADVSMCSNLMALGIVQRHPLHATWPASARFSRQSLLQLAGMAASIPGLAYISLDTCGMYPLVFAEESDSLLQELQEQADCGSWGVSGVVREVYELTWSLL